MNTITCGKAPMPSCQEERPSKAETAASTGPVPPVVAPELGHVPASEAVPNAVEPVAQPRRAGRPFPGYRQPSHEVVNLVMGERHVPHQQADQFGQGEAHGWGRVHEPRANSHRGGQQAKQGLQGERVRRGLSHLPPKRPANEVSKLMGILGAKGNCCNGSRRFR